MINKSTWNTFEFLTHAQHKMSSRLAKSTFLFPTYLGTSKETLLAGKESIGIYNNKIKFYTKAQLETLCIDKEKQFALTIDEKIIGRWLIFLPI